MFSIMLPAFKKKKINGVTFSRYVLRLKPKLSLRFTYVHLKYTFAKNELSTSI